MTTAASSEVARSPRGRRVARPSGEDRERAILVTAERLLAEHGLDGFSVDDLARGAGLSRPTFYFYFASKDAVLLTLLDRVIEEVDARYGALVREFAADPVGCWRRSIQSTVEVFAAHKAVVTAVVQARASSPQVRDLWGSTMRRWITLSAQMIDAERARGAARPGQPADHLAIALNLMNERVLAATFTQEPQAIDEAAVTEVLLGVWLSSIYGTTDPV